MILYDSPYYGVTAIDMSLEHSGTKGMKWHHRRWQNYDGSLTPAGREHYGVGKARNKAKTDKDTWQSGKRTLDQIEREYNARSKQWRKEHPAPAKPASPDQHGEYQKAMRAWQKEQKNDPELRRLAQEHYIADKMRETLSDDELKLKSKDQYEYYKRMMKDCDSRSIKDKKAKEKFEAFVLDGATKDQLTANDRQSDLNIGLSMRIASKSGSWYTGESVTKRHAKALSAYNDAQSKLAAIANEIDSATKKNTKNFTYDDIQKAREANKRYGPARNDFFKAEDDLCSTVLKDIGYEDTEQNRKKVYYVIFDD